MPINTGDLQIEIKVGGKRRNFDLNEELAINQKELNTELAKQPAKFAWYGVLAALANRILEEKKAAKKVTYAKLDKEYRASYAEAGTRITEDLIEQSIYRDPIYHVATKEEIDAEYNYEVLKTASQSFDQRKDMLVAIASNLRKELDTDLSIRSKK